MISGWYRTGEQRITGGYRICPLVYADHNEYVDNQGGACDNDVHEHFKCLEETLLKKAFVIVDEGVRAYNCSAMLQDGILTVVPYGECKYIHVNTCIPLSVRTGTTVTNIEKGMYMLSYTSNDDI